MHARSALSLAIAAAALTQSLTGCAETRPPLADTWGLSVRMAVESQKLDPTPANDRAVTGLDGPYAKNALEIYRKSAEPDQQSKDKGSPVELLLSTKGGK